MIPSTNRHKSVSALVLLSLLSIPLVAGYYMAGSKPNTLFEGVKERKAGADLDQHSRIARDKITLVKNESITVNDCRLVFKGLEKDRILLDLYLLDLDPQYAYQQTISKAAAHRGIRLGDAEYRLISVGKDMLRLKTSNLFKTL